jgi:hypothetical protein
MPRCNGRNLESSFHVLNPVPPSSCVPLLSRFRPTLPAIALATARSLRPDDLHRGGPLDAMATSAAGSHSFAAASPLPSFRAVFARHVGRADGVRLAAASRHCKEARNLVPPLRPPREDLDDLSYVGAPLWRARLSLAFRSTAFMLCSFHPHRTPSSCVPLLFRFRPACLPAKNRRHPEPVCRSAAGEGHPARLHRAGVLAPPPAGRDGHLRGVPRAVPGAQIAAPSPPSSGRGHFMGCVVSRQERKSKISTRGLLVFI